MKKIYLNQVDIDVQIKNGNINMVDLEKMYLDDKIIFRFKCHQEFRSKFRL